MPAPAVLPLVAGGGTKLLSALGLVKNLTATGAAVAGGTALAGPFIAPGLFGQSAEQVLQKDGDRAEYNPDSGKYEVKRDAREQIFDKLFGREEAIQTQGEKNRLKSLLADQGTKDLLAIRPDLKGTITGQTSDAELGNLILKTRDQKRLIDSIKATGLEPRSTQDLYNLDVGQLQALNTQRTGEKAVADTTLAAETKFNLPQAIAERERLARKEYRIDRDRLDLQRQQLRQERDKLLDRQDQFRIQTMQYDLQNRRLDMQEARNFRQDRQKAIMQIMQGFQQMGNAFAY